MALSAFSLALNQYFNLRRNYAIGIGMTLTGLGPIFYPPLIAVLLHHYGTAGCVLILSALCAHIVLAALLLQPVEWHQRSANDGDSDVEMRDLNTETETQQQYPVSTDDSSATAAQLSADHQVDAQSIYGADQISLIPASATGHRQPASYYSAISAVATSTIESSNTKANIDDTPTPLKPTLAARRHAPHFERSISHVLARPPSVETPGRTPRSPVIRKPFLRWFESGSVASVHLASSVDVFGESVDHYRIGSRSSRRTSANR